MRCIFKSCRYFSIYGRYMKIQIEKNPWNVRTIRLISKDLGLEVEMTSLFAPADRRKKLRKKI